MTVWDYIAQAWSNYRQQPFSPEIEELANKWKGTILDVGCGNGRNLVVFKGEKTGIDNSKEMLREAKKFLTQREVEATLIHASMTKLPFEKETFDHVICIAALHCVSLQEQRAALKEMKRVLKKKGTLYVTVWNKWQKQFLFKKRETNVPWNVKGRTYQRYYYLHDRISFARLTKAILGNTRIKGVIAKNLVMQYSKQ